ncbi:MAG: serine/threonine-protein kinase PknK [Isosphaeraceae bacterium]
MAKTAKKDSCRDGDRVAEFRRLWEESASPPDLSLFLAAQPDASLSECLVLLQIDQQFRWKRGQPRPIQTYLRQFPEIAMCPDLVRLLVEGDQQGRRASGDQPRGLLEGTTEIASSHALTQVIGGPRSDQETLAEDLAAQALTGVYRQRPNSAGATHDPELPPTRSGPQLGVELDAPPETQGVAELLRPKLENMRFTLLRRLGAGGMGVVFEAYDEKRGELVALKTMRRVDPATLVRFKQEFRVLADITHPNLVNLYQLFAIKDRWFFTMELVDGCDILTWIRGEPDSVPTPPGTAANGPLGRHLPLDECRLRDALTQLAEGVQALHNAGKLHRDIKPTNVLVTSDSRLVLLDFGLTADMEPTGQLRTADRQVVGTVAHMSPEQAMGLAVSPASDWYSVGVILYQALCGRLPFDGNFDEVVLQKQTTIPPAPDAECPGLADDLVRLCSALLERNPARRPDGATILRQLRGQAEPVRPRREIRPSVSLYGRAPHLHVLDSAYDLLVNRQAATVFVFGRTGTGKTTLVRTFLDDLASRSDTLVLWGRCYQQECFPFKAVDSLIDALARYLKGLEPDELARLLPRNSWLLGRVFPVLRGLDRRSALTRACGELPDPQELRLHVFSGLRELLARLGRETNLVLAIDDLHWGDADSASFLADLIHAPDPPVMLLVGCFRSEDAEDNRFLHIFNQASSRASAGPSHFEMTVEALTQAESRELALALLGREDPLSRAQAHLVARESGGNPLFIDELVKHVQSGAMAEACAGVEGIGLESVLWSRIQAQSADAQRLLEVVTIAGGPIREVHAFRAAQLGAGGRVALAPLRSARLIRGSGDMQLDQIETYHARIRATVLKHLPEATRRSHHAQLAEVLEASGQAEAEVIADHLRNAGESQRAKAFCIMAADKAAAALAFDRAARLYRLALELDPDAATECQLRRRLGDALSNSGRGAEAAAMYLLAAGEKATAAECLELRHLTSTQLLISGHVDEGLTLLQTVLRPLGLSMPRTRRQALFSLYWRRGLLRLRGLGFRWRDETQVSAEDLTRVDLCWSAVAGLSVIDPILGADFQTRGLLLSLRAGEPFRIARCLAMEAAHRSTAGNRAARSALTLLQSAQDLAQRLGSPHALAIVELARGVAALMLGKWKNAHQSLDEAQSLLRNRCTGVTWERDTVQSLALWALLHMGQIAEFKRRWKVLIRQAQDCGDLYAASTLTTFYMTMIRLADDDAGGIEAELETVMNRWATRGFFIQHSTAFRSLIHLELYRGQADSAWSRLTSTWPSYSRSKLLRIQMIRIQMLELRARSAVALAETGSEPAKLLETARRDALRLDRERQPWASAYAQHVRAAIAACRGDASTALHELSQAASQYEKADMMLCAWVMRYKMGEIQGGSKGRELISQATEWMSAQSIQSPTRWAKMIAPGFEQISTCHLDTTL